jgi:hypothetical protein
MSKAELRKEWELRIADFRASGQTQSKWCADNHVKLHQLKYWLKKFEKTIRSRPHRLNGFPSHWMNNMLNQKTPYRFI